MFQLFPYAASHLRGSLDWRAGAGNQSGLLSLQVGPHPYFLNPFDQAIEVVSLICDANPMHGMAQS